MATGKKKGNWQLDQPASPMALGCLGSIPTSSISFLPKETRPGSLKTLKGRPKKLYRISISGLDNSLDFGLDVYPITLFGHPESELW
jgi:hypothetical protein